MNSSNESLDLIRLECPEVPEDIVRRVGNEVLSQQYDPAIWARALAGVNKRKDEALATYSRLRILQLMERRERESERTNQREYRRLNHCLGVSTVAELLSGMSRVGRINIPRPRIPYLWLALFFIGWSGVTAAAMRLFEEHLMDSVVPTLPAVAICSGVIATMLLLFTSRLAPSHLAHWLWNDGIVAACLVVCVGSVMLGTKVMMKYPHENVGPRGGKLVQASFDSSVSKVSDGLMAPRFQEPEKRLASVEAEEPLR